MDQALEKRYNKPAKGPSRVIRHTKRKQAVCKWNIIKHEKCLFRKALTKICKLETGNQYSLHDNFCKFTTDGQSAEKMISHTNERGSPFDISVTITMNVVSGDNELLVFKANCLDLGEEEYQKIKDERLEKKVIKLIDPIQKVKMKDWRRRSSN